MEAVTLALVAKKWFCFEFDRELRDEDGSTNELDVIRLTKTVDYGTTDLGGMRSVTRAESCVLYLVEISPGFFQLSTDADGSGFRRIFDGTECQDELSFVDFMVKSMRSLGVENFVLNLAGRPFKNVD